jgi:hypothetical protein|tara:strand:- start:27 stop:539 length:513 start_codon:yes stop_codon:yes gene_type:complete
MPFKQFASCEPPEKSNMGETNSSSDYDDNWFFVKVLLSEEHADLTDRVIEDLQKFVQPLHYRNELHFYLLDDDNEETMIIERYDDDVKLIKDFAEWMSEYWAGERDILDGLPYEGLDEGKEVISYSKKTFSFDERVKMQHWIISLTDYGFRLITQVVAEAKKRTKEISVL